MNDLAAEFVQLQMMMARVIGGQISKLKNHEPFRRLAI